MFNKILFPTDGSKYSKKAMEIVFKFARKFDSKVIVLHCHEIPLVEHYPYYISNQELEVNLLESSKRVLADAKADFDESQIKFEGFFKEGKAGPLITETAENEKCDLIIMGTRGLGGLKGFLLGSVSNYVIHHAKCPVFLNPQREE